MKELIENSETVLCENKSDRYERELIGIAYLAIAIGFCIRSYLALTMPWREDEIAYVKWVGEWFSRHFFTYFFQFQQVVYPPRSPIFTNPPGATWIFALAIRLGELFGVSPLYASRFSDVVISAIGAFILFRTIKSWLNTGIATAVVAFYSFLPIIAVTDGSAFLEPLLGFLAILALKFYLRLNKEVNWNNVFWLAFVLGLTLIVKLSLIVPFFLIGLISLIKLVHRRKVGLAVGFALTSILTPLLLWAGYRTPSQFSGVYSFLSNKLAAPPTVINNLRYPFSFISDVPTVIVILWLTAILAMILSKSIRSHLPEGLIVFTVLPLIGLSTLYLLEPTGGDYLIVPLMPFVFLAPCWIISRFLRAQNTNKYGWGLASVAFLELVLSYTSTPISDLSLASTPVGQAIRHLDPTIDVPYGTGSEPIPQLVRFIKANLPKNAHIAAVYDNYPLREYLANNLRYIGPWFPNQSIGSLAGEGYQYAVIAYHYSGYDSKAAKSTLDLRPLDTVKIAGIDLASIYKVPSRSVARNVVVNLGGPWQYYAPGVTITSQSVSSLEFSVTGVVKPARSANTWIAATDVAPIPLNHKSRQISIDLWGSGETETMTVDLLDPITGNYLRSDIVVDWRGFDKVVLSISRFKSVVINKSASPAHLKHGLLIRFGVDNQSGSELYMRIRSLLLGS